jgi:aspartyl-tRNA(Asn)/glutamyl-tRNA(Gln) amidotransferase subunit B
MFWSRCLPPGKRAAAVIEEKGLVQVSDTGEIDRVIDEVIAANPNQLEQYRVGKETLLDSLSVR